MYHSYAVVPKIVQSRGTFTVQNIFSFINYYQLKTTMKYFTSLSLLKTIHGPSDCYISAKMTNQEILHLMSLVYNLVYFVAICVVLPYAHVIYIILSLLKVIYVETGAFAKK